MIVDSSGTVVDHVVTLTLSHCVVIEGLVLDQSNLSAVYDTFPDVFLVPKVKSHLVLGLSGILHVLMYSTFLRSEEAMRLVYPRSIILLLSHNFLPPHMQLWSSRL